MSFDLFGLISGVSLLLSGSLGVGWVAGHYQRRRWYALINAWRSVAEHFGLNLGNGGAGVLKLEGDLGSIHVCVTTRDGSDASRTQEEPTHQCTRFVIRSPEIPPWLVLAPAVPGSLWGGQRGGGLSVGDEGFDQLVQVAGDQLRLHALLDIQTRRRLLDTVFRFGARVRNQEIVYTEPNWVRDPERLGQLLQMLLSMAKQLSMDDEEIPQRLLENAQNEPLERVRNRDARLLVDFFPSSPQAHEITQWCLTHESPELRVFGALTMSDEEARAWLLDAMRSPLGDEEVRAWAVFTLITWLRGDDTEEVVHQALRLESTVRQATIRAIARTKDQELYRILLDRASQWGEDVQAVGELCRALETAPFEVEAALLSLLDRVPPAARTLVVRTLGTRGTIRCVERLLEIEQSGFGRTPLKGAARKAIEAVQARAQSGQSGGLSLVEAKKGALSVQEQVPLGAISLNEPELQSDEK